jgi:hypothetical protein
VATQFKARVVWRQEKWVCGLEFRLFAFLSSFVILVIRRSVMDCLLSFEYKRLKNIEQGSLPLRDLEKMSLLKVVGPYCL